MLKITFVLCLTVFFVNVDQVIAILEGDVIGNEIKKFIGKLLLSEDDHDLVPFDKPHVDVDLKDKELAILHKIFGKESLDNKHLLNLITHEKDKLALKKTDFDEHLWEFVKSLEIVDFKKMLPVLLHKANILDHHEIDLFDHHKFKIDEELWGLFKKLETKELLKLLPLLLITARVIHDHHEKSDLMALDFGAKAAGAAVLGSVLKNKFDGHAFHLTDDLWNILKAHEAAEAAKLISLLVGGKIAGDIALKGADDLSKIIPLLLTKDKIDHDIRDKVHLDESLWAVLKGLGTAEAAKILPLLVTGKVAGDIAVAKGADDLSKIIPLLLVKDKIDHEIKHDIHLDEGTWALVKGLEAAEAAKIIPLLVGGKIAGDVAFEAGKIDHHIKHDFHLDESLWGLLKGLGAAEAAKLLPLLVAGKVATDTAVVKGADDLSKILPLLLVKDKIDHDFKHDDVHLDDGTWALLKGLEAAEAAKIIPLLVGGKLAADAAFGAGEASKLIPFLLAKGKIDHDLHHDFHLDEKLWVLLKGLEAAEAAKIIGLLMKGKTKLDLAGWALKDKVEIDSSLLNAGIKSAEIAKLLPLLFSDKEKVDHGLLNLDTSIWSLLKGFEAAEAAKLLPVLLGKEKLDLFGIGHGPLHIDDHIWALFKGLEAAEAVKLLPLLLGLAAKGKTDIDAKVFEGIKSAELAKLLPSVLNKHKIDVMHHDHHLFDLDASVWALLKGLEAAEVAKLLPLILGKEKLDLLGLGHGPHHLDENIWNKFKHLEASEAAKLLPLVLGLAVKSKVDLDKSLVEGISAAELAKLLPILLGKDKIEHDLFDFDEKVWALIKGLEAAEVAKLLPVILGKEKLDMLGLGHGPLHIHDHIWKLFKGLEAAEAAKLFTFLLTKGKLDLTGSMIKDKIDFDASLLVGTKAAELAAMLGKEKLDHNLFKIDDPLWASLRKLKAAELAKVLPAVIGKDKLALLGVTAGGLLIDEELWEICKGFNAAEFAKFLPLLLKEKAKLDTHIAKDLSPLIKTFKTKDFDRDYFLDNLKYDAISVHADDCVDCYYDNGYYYTEYY